MLLLMLMLMLMILYPHADSHADAFDDELAARLEAGEVVSLGGKVLNSHADDAVSSC